MSFVGKMGRKTLLTLEEAANRAKADDLSIVQFVDQNGNYGYRTYEAGRRSGPSAMGDCEGGWGVRYQGRYVAGIWLAGRTLADQEFISDPLAGTQ